MSKKILSWVLALALIMTCFSGIAMISSADESDLPPVYAYAYFDENGAVVASEGASIKKYNNSYSNPPACTEGTLIPGTDNLYGYTYGTANYGLIFAGKNLANVAENKPVVYAIEYYIPGDAELTGSEILQMEDRVHGMRAIQGLPKGRGVVYYTLTAEDVEMRRNSDNWMMVRLRAGSINKLYITGFKVLDAEAAGVPSDPNAYFCGTKTDYYPNTPIVVTSVNPAVDSDGNGHKESTTLTLQPRFGVNHVYLIARNELATSSASVNKPLYLKVYAKDGVEDGTEINISSFEASDGSSRGHSTQKLGLSRNPSFFVENGVAGLYLPETSFGGNTLKEGSVAVGSLRFSYAAYNNIARIEAYDVETYCAKAGSDEAMIAEIHAAMVANNSNVTEADGVYTCATCGEEIVLETECTHENTTLTGKVDADCVNPGYTGDEVCDDCGETVTEGTATDALGHDEGVLQGAVAADCVNPGYTGDLVCGVCGETITKGTATEPTDHNGQLEGKVDAVINGAAGYTGNVVCTGCGEVLEEGKEIVATFENGVYRENGKAVSYKGLVEIDGGLYYINNGARPQVGRYYITKTNDIEGITKGYHYFDETGKMVGTGVFDGYYYVKGRAVTGAGIVEIDGALYFVTSTGSVKTGRYAVAAAKTNGLVAAGIYYFGEDGALAKNVVADGFYYGADDGRCVAYRGLVKVGDYYYYVNNNGQVQTGRYYITKLNEFDGTITKGYKNFADDGKMIID